MPGGIVTRLLRRSAAPSVGLRAAALAAALAAGGALAPSAGAAAWGARAHLSDPVVELITGSPGVAALDDGRLLVAWRKATGRRGPLHYEVDAAARPAPGRAWHRLGPLGPGVQHPHVSLGAGGSRAVLAFPGPGELVPSGGPFPGYEQRVLARVLEDGAWTRATVLSSPRRVVSAAHAAVDGGGVALAVWQEAVPPAIGAQSAGEVRASARPPGGAWESPTALSAPASHDPALVAGPAGALAAWVTDEPGGAVWASARRVGGGWGPPERLSASPSSSSTPAVALNAAGEGVAAWYEGDAVVVAARGRDGAWAEPRQVSGDVPAEDAAGRPAPRVAIDDPGHLALAWRARIRPGTVDVRAASRPAGGAWSEPRTLSRPAERGAGVPALALRGGRAMVAWAQQRGGEAALVAREADVRTGAWSPTERVSAPGEDGLAPALVLDARGRATCAYVSITRKETSRRAITVRVAERSPAPPPARGPVRLTREQLLVNQRIGQAALRRANAVLARIDEGLTAADIRQGSLTATAFGPGVAVGGIEAAQVVDPGPSLPVEVAPPGRRGARPELGAEQLLVNQRISQAAVRRTALARWRLDQGLTGADVLDGALGAAHLAPGLAIVSADSAAAPVPRPYSAPPTFPGGGGRVRLSREQLGINQRISQAAVRRANALVAQVEGGFGGEDLRDGSLGGADIRPEAR